MKRRQGHLPVIPCRGSVKLAFAVIPCQKPFAELPEMLYNIRAFLLIEAGITLLILATYRNKIYKVMIDMKITINIGLFLLVSMLNVGVGENMLLVGNEEATSLSD